MKFSQLMPNKSPQKMVQACNKLNDREEDIAKTLIWVDGSWLCGQRQCFLAGAEYDSSQSLQLICEQHQTVVPVFLLHQQLSKSNTLWVVVAQTLSLSIFLSLFSFWPLFFELCMVLPFPLFPFRFKSVKFLLHLMSLYSNISHFPWHQSYWNRTYVTCMSI